jgi:hypothetical protein
VLRCAISEIGHPRFDPNFKHTPYNDKSGCGSGCGSGSAGSSGSGSAGSSAGNIDSVLELGAFKISASYRDLF